MRFTWQRRGGANASANPISGTETFGALTTEGLRFLLHSLNVKMNNLNNSPNPAGVTAWSLGESSPLSAFLAGTMWLLGSMTYGTASPGIDLDTTYDWGDEGLLIPSHTPFNEYRRFGYAAGQPTSFIVEPPYFLMQFSFAFAYEMTGFQINWLS